MRERILVIDDDAVIRRLLQRLLAGRGFDVQLAADGEQGLALLREGEPPRAVICDLMMPGISGLEVMGAIRGDERLMSLPVLMLTGEGFDETRGTALEHGADLYMTKPFSSYELLDALGQLLADRRIA
jgi:CheY-like chemotaxis protein